MTDIEDPPPTEPQPVATQVRSLMPQRPEPRGERTPVRQEPIPDELRHPIQALRAYMGDVKHQVAFHAGHVHRYIGRAVRYSLPGIARLAIGLYKWTVDWDTLCKLRSLPDEPRFIPEHLALSRTRDGHVRERRLATLAILLGIGGLGFLGYIMVGPIVTGILALLAVGWFGRPADRPFIESAIVGVPGARRITGDQLVKAFRAAKIVGKEGEDIEFIGVGVHRDGDGWAATIHMPEGKTATDAIKARMTIASNLRIDEARLFIERVRGDQGSAGLVDVYVANKDPFASKDGVPSPLSKAKSFSIWKPVPFGYTARGKTISFLLVWTGVLIGAMPRMGKSFAARLLAAAGALDITVRQIVFNGKHGKDWSAFKDVAHAYGAGARDQVVEYLIQTLRECVEDMNRRYELLDTLSDEECPEGKVTPALCERKDLDMPLVQIIIDEAQEYLDHPEYGKHVKALLIKLAKLAPAVGYMLIISTQKPDGDTIPTSLRDQLAARFCLKTANNHSSIVVLGKLGDGDSRPEDLDPSQRGTGVLLGADVDGLAGAGAQVVRSHKMDLVDLRRVCTRGRELREAAGALTGYAAGDLPEEPIPDMFLEHVHGVLGSTEEWVWSSEVCERLGDSQSDLYDGWEPEDLGSALARYGVETKYRGGKADGKRVTWKAVLRRDVIDALARKVGNAPNSPADEGL